MIGDESRSKLAKLISQIFVLHLYGDEVVTDELKGLMVDWFTDLDMPQEDIDSYINKFFKLDFFPADNNVTIQF